MAFGLHCILDRKYYIDLGSNRNEFLDLIVPNDHILKIFDIYEDEFSHCKPCVDYWCGIFIIRYLSVRRDNIDVKKLYPLLLDINIYKKVLEVQNGNFKKKKRVN